MSKKKKATGDLFRTASDWDAICESVYSHYPRKVGRKSAIEAIRSAITEVELRPNMASIAPQWLADRVKLYAECVKGMEKCYIPHPATWFNAGRYDDGDDEWTVWKEKSHGPTPRDSDGGEVVMGDCVKPKPTPRASVSAITREIMGTF